MRAIAFPLAVVLGAAIVLPADACRVPRPKPTKAEAAAVERPKIGFVGRVLETYPDGGSAGRGIVEIEVTEDFSRSLPRVIQVVNPGCCVCMGIRGSRGDEVVSIVRRGDGNDNLFYLDY